MNVRPCWMYFSHEHCWTEAVLQRHMKEIVQPHHPIWTSAAKGRKTEGDAILLTNPSLHLSSLCAHKPEIDVCVWLSK